MNKFLKNKCLTLLSLFKFFLKPKRAMYFPLLIVLLLLSVLLIFTKGLSVVAPFVYTLF